MDKKIVSVTIFILISLWSVQAEPLKEFFKETDLFLKKYVQGGQVSYGKVKANFSEVESLYRQIGALRLEQVDKKSKKAFYINAYNMVVIYYVAKNLPLKSPMDQPGFFDQVKHVVAGERLTLNELEKVKLLSVYKDARIHFVLACAAKSCPPLASVAYLPDDLEKQLNDRSRLSLNDPKWLRVDKSQKKVYLSKIFEWYTDDFTRNGESLIAWINQYRTEKIPTSYAIGYYDYNWALNGM